MNVHLLCYKSGLSTFYGPNFLPVIADTQGFHPYSEKWFRKTLFYLSPIGSIEPAVDWTYEMPDYEDRAFKRNYFPNPGYEIIQGQGIVCGRLIGGHTGISELENQPTALVSDDFENSVLFIEDIPEFFTPDSIANFFKWLGKKGFLEKLSGVIIGRICENINFDEHGSMIKNMISVEFGLKNLPVLYGLNFGHSSPVFMIPYGAKAEINCENKSFSILESGVI
jgi:muramoyltetrapeptide carboxypeptidase LdcA involved in peptidoglycan recycling